MNVNMKIAIFGDSFAHTEPFLEHKAWYQKLREKGYDITVFSKTGSSLWYSYNEFVKYQKNFDRCIFLITSWGRMYLPQLTQPFWPGIRQIEADMANPNIPQHDRNVLISTYNWLVCARNDEEHISYHDMMIREISSLRPDALLIPCFYYDLSRVPEWKYCTPFDIQLIDLFFYKIDYQDSDGNWRRKQLRRGGRELRACHFNDENNIIFADKISQWIDTGNFSMDIREFVNPTKPVEYYFEIEN